MDVDDQLALLLHGNQLKRTTRTGWVQRGVPLPENVAAHTFGVVYAVLLLAEWVKRPIDLAAALAMAALHDLPEDVYKRQVEPLDGVLGRAVHCLLYTSGRTSVSGRIWSGRRRGWRTRGNMPIW